MSTPLALATGDTAAMRPSSTIPPERGGSGVSGQPDASAADATADASTVDIAGAGDSMAVTSLRSALMIAFHFPPFTGSSGALRTLGFVRYLPEFGWRGSVLTATACAYERTSDDALALIPAGTRVRRALALDVRRHLSFRGRYIERLALPDRWASWLPAAVIRGVAGVMRDRAEVVWSTYPIATAHIIGSMVARLTGRPWVADFRDPMVEQNARTGEWAPSDPALRRARLSVERLCVRHAARVVFCTEGARDIFIKRYGDSVVTRCKVIENGYDEQAFVEAEKRPSRKRSEDAPFTVLHSGVIYPTPDRDPSRLFEALANMKRGGRVAPGDLRFVLRATGNDAEIQARIDHHGVGDIVHLAPSIPYVDALREMMDADALLVLQGYTSDPAVPAKLYEYLRAGRPLLALVSPTGETARVARRSDLCVSADIESVEDIEIAVGALLDRLRAPQSDDVRELPDEYSRRGRARSLAGVLGEL